MNRCQETETKMVGHVCRFSCFAKTILQGTMKENKKRQTEEEARRQYQIADRNRL